DTVPRMRPRRRARPSMKNATVEPVPTPTMVPSSTKPSAASAESLFCSSLFMRMRLRSFHREDRLPLRGRHRHHREAAAALDQGEFAERLRALADLVEPDPALELA